MLIYHGGTTHCGVEPQGKVITAHGAELQIHCFSL